MLQLAFATDEAGAEVKIQAIRMRSSDGKETLGTLEARAPTRWTGSAYEPWDERLPPDAETKASYKLGGPNWVEVQKKLGTDSYVPTYVLEVDIEIDGQLRTLSSAATPRERPHRVVT